MGQDSKIEWTHHTFNPWRGCTKVSDGCKHCYADTLSKRNPKTLGVWGPNGTRVVAADAYWKQPYQWACDAVNAGERRRVFCASLADVFEGDDTMPAESRRGVRDARRRLFQTIGETPDLDWLLLTKRPENINALIGGEFGVGLSTFVENYPNVWLGTSVENQAAADERIPHLLRCPASVRFLSCEPLLGPVSIARWLKGASRLVDIGGGYARGDGQNLHWVIVGGESGPGARPFNVQWARDIISQCKSAEVACFVKQLGAVPFADMGGKDFCTALNIKDKKGGDWSGWSEDLRVREFPAPHQEGAAL